MSASSLPEMAPSTSVGFVENRPRRSRRLTVLLSALTLVNLGGVVLTISFLADVSEHGREGLAAPLTFSLITTLVGLAGLGGAWSMRRWGPWLYLAAVVVDRLVAVVAYPEAITPVLVVGVLLAVGLVVTFRRA
jgi:hypothetical protein